MGYDGRAEPKVIRVRRLKKNRLAFVKPAQIAGAASLAKHSPSHLRGEINIIGDSPERHSFKHNVHCALPLGVVLARSAGRTL